MEDELAEMAKAEGGYQPIVVKEKIVFKGWRSCKARWDLIKPHLEDGQMIMDIGSHYGYFTYEIARNFPKSMVWSLEGGSTRAEIQQGMLQANKFKNVVLSEDMFTLSMTEQLLGTCFMGDVALMLSVAHYFDPGDLPKMIANVSKLFHTLIIEYPSQEETEVAKREIVQQTDILRILNENFATVKAIGEGASPKHFDVGRTIYKCTNAFIKRKATSYIGGGREHDVIYDSTWDIDLSPREYVGMTIEDLRHFGMLYPDTRVVLNTAARAYDEFIKFREGKVSDIHIRNVLLTPNGVQLIDTDEGLDKPFIYEIPMKQYIKRTLERANSGYHNEEFECMWDGSWEP